MTAKEFLKRYEYADLRAKRYEDEYKLEHELIGSISINYDGMPHGNGISRKTENDALKLAEKAERSLPMTPCSSTGRGSGMTQGLSCNPTMHLYRFRCLPDRTIVPAKSKER